VLEFADEHFAHLVSDAIVTRAARPRGHNALLPTGYTDAFRAIGHTLDRWGATDVALVELEQRLVVCGRRPTEGDHETEYASFEWVLTEEDLLTQLDGGYNWRGGADRPRAVG